jgi:hypothetical protein
MAKLQIVRSKRIDLQRSEFETKPLSGNPSPHQIFEYQDEQAAWEFVIVSIAAATEGVRLCCLNWLPKDGFLEGATVETRELKARERKRYSRFLT